MHGGLINAFRQNVYSEATRLIGSRALFAANPIHSTTATSLAFHLFSQVQFYGLQPKLGRTPASTPIVPDLIAIGVK